MGPPPGGGVPPPATSRTSPGTPPGTPPGTSGGGPPGVEDHLGGAGQQLLGVTPPGGSPPGGGLRGEVPRGVQNFPHRRGGGRPGGRPGVPPGNPGGFPPGKTSPVRLGYPSVAGVNPRGGPPSSSPSVATPDPSRPPSGGHPRGGFVSGVVPGPTVEVRVGSLRVNRPGRRGGGSGSSAQWPPR